MTPEEEEFIRETKYWMESCDKCSGPLMALYHPEVEQNGILYPALYGYRCPQCDIEWWEEPTIEEPPDTEAHFLH